MNGQQRDIIVEAIRSRSRIQLGYERLDGSRSLHIVAPVDLRRGDRPSTAEVEYLWAYCFAENKAETHNCDRVLTV